MSTKKQQRIAMLEMLICAVLWSIAGLFMKWLPWSALAIASLRSFFSSLTVVAFMVFTRQRFRLTKKVVLNALFLCATFLCFCGANKLTTSANAIVLQFTSPIWIMLFSAVLFKQKFHWYEYVSVTFTIGGIALVFVDGLHLGGMAGIVVGLFSGVFMAAMFITVGKTEKEEKMSGILLGHVLTFLVGLPFVFLTKPEITGTRMLFILILGVVQLGIPYILLGLASDHCPPLPACLLSAAEPLLNPVWVALFGGEIPSRLAILGGVVVIIAVTFQCICDQKQKAPAPCGCEQKQEA